MTVESLITQHIDTWTSAVKTQSTSGRGSRKKLDLYGIKKLRELILELAVRGKLVPQDPNDEPASVLLERIAAEKLRLVKDKKIKKTIKLSDISEKELHFELPLNWQVKRLPDVYYSISPSNKKLKSKDILTKGNYPVIDQGQEFIAGYSNDENRLVYIDHPVIIFGDHTRNIKYVDFNFIPGADGTKILCPILINPKYFHLYLNSYDLESRGYGRHFKILNDNLFFIPPLAEQHRIVAKVDELMALCDQLEQQTEASIEAHQLLVTTLLNTLTHSADTDALMENWARISDHFDTLFTTEESIDQLKQTILQLAVMGKLVAQDPNDEPASVLLERIAEEKAQLVKEKKIKKQKPLPPITDDEKLFELPKGWDWCRLDDICYGISSGSTPPKTNFSEQEGVPYLKVYNIRDQNIDFNYKAQYIDEECHKGKLGRSILKPGDVVMNIVGPPLGKIAIIPSMHPEWNCNQAITFFRPLVSSLNTYIYTYLITGIFLNSIELIGTAGQDNISVTKSRSIVLPTPPLQEQVRLVSKVNELLSVCEELRRRIRNNQQIQLHLTDAIIEQEV